MRELELTIRPSVGETADRTATAWFVAGAAPDTWVTQVLASGASTTKLRFRPVGRGGGQAVGVVVSGVDTDPRPGWIPYVKMANRFFVPRAARFHPHVTEAELADLAISDSIAEYVWHPTSGLIAFEASQVLRMADLLTVPAAGNSNWNCADPGVAICRRLASVLPDAPLTLDAIIESGRDDIGTDATDIGTAPRSPDESSAFFDLLSSALRPAAHAAAWLARHSPGTASTPTWLNTVGDWAAGVLRNSGISQSKRMNELRRLMSMLDGDPDQGLRYAIPFGGDASRGIATGSNELIGHGVDFGRGYGGGPADYWDMPYEMQMALTARYRELAQREVSLGRYRRAAYIYATLLGDESAAAQVLVDGGYYREAAQLYRDKLGNARKAADCLLKGGLWPDAVEIYTELGDWPAVADVYEKLEDHESARQAWHKACDAYVSAGNYLEASKVHETRLDNPGTAEEMLVLGWERSACNKKCLAELFRLFQRTESHDKSRIWVKQLGADQRLSVRQQREVAGLFAELSRDYPNALLRAAAFDQSRQIVAKRLATGTYSDQRQFLPVLEELIPTDKLLGRDCRRFIERKKLRPHRPPAGKLQRVERLRLRDDVIWEAATCSGTSVFVAGFSGDSLVVASWSQERHPTFNYHAFTVPAERQTQILLVPSPSHSGHVMLHVHESSGGEFLGSVMSQRGANRIRPLPFFDATVTAAGAGCSGTICTLGVSYEGIVLRGSLERGSPVFQWALPVEIDSAQPDSFVTPIGDRIVCVLDNTFVVVKSSMPGADERVTTADFPATGQDALRPRMEFDQFWLPGKATGACAVENSDSPRVAISMREGGVVHWLLADRKEPFGADLQEPACQFMANEDLVVADRLGAIEVYRTRNNTVTLRAAGRGDAGVTVAVLAGVHISHESTNEFLLVRADGRIDVWGYQT